MGETEELTIGSLLRKTREKGRNVRYCVIGAGHGGMCLAAHLGLMGFPVRIYNRSDEHLYGIRWQGGIRLTGAVEGFGPVELATCDIHKAIEDVDVIMVVTPATAHRSLALLMAPHLHNGQIIVLNPGRTGGALEVRNSIKTQAPDVSVIVAEAQTFLYASRAMSRSEGHIYKIKNAVPLATLPSCWIPDVLAILNEAFPCFVPGNNVLSTSLENIGAVFHPALTIMNAGWIEGSAGDFDYYLQGITPSVAVLLEKIDAERMAVAAALGLQSVSAREWLYRSYDSHGKSLYEAIRNTGAYSGLKAPTTINHRYIWEDVPMSLVPMSSLGSMLGIATPTIDMIINLGSILHGKDYRAEGRTTEHMGLSGLTVKQIQQLAAGVSTQPLPVNQHN